MDINPERQVNAEKLIAKLREQNSELSFANAISQTVIEELEEQLQTALRKIDELSPTEEISNAPEAS